MNKPQHRQAGLGLFGILAILALIVGAAVGWNAYRKSEARTDAERASAAAAALNVSRQQSEQAALDAQLAKQKALTSLQQSFKSVDDLYVRWQDALKISESSARMSLAGPVATLQQIQREAGALVVPPCLEQGKTQLVDGMGQTIEGFLTFMRNSANLGNVLSAEHFDKARVNLAAFESARKACPAGAPTEK